MSRGGGVPGGGGVPFGPLFEIFQPGITHLVEERERQQLDIVQREDGDPPWDVDLDAGTAVLRRPVDGAAQPSTPVAPGPTPEDPA